MSHLRPVLPRLPFKVLSTQGNVKRYVKNSFTYAENDNGFGVSYLTNVKSVRFQSQLEASHGSSHTGELWYNETVCLWQYIFTHTNTYTDFVNQSLSFLIAEVQVEWGTNQRYKSPVPRKIKKLTIWCLLSISSHFYVLRDWIEREQKVLILKQVVFFVLRHYQHSSHRRLCYNYYNHDKNSTFNFWILPYKQ